MRTTILLLLTLGSFSNTPADEPTTMAIKELGRFKADEAHQAVAIDATSIYAISNRTIAQYAKEPGQPTSKPLQKWTADDDSPIRHLNSGMVHDGRLYCANSNWPATPLKNSIEIFDAKSLQHLQRKAFSESAGAINWIDRHHSAWWIVFAFYGEAQVRRTRLVRYDDQWRETGTWTFPESVIERFLPNSNSGGSFGPHGQLFVTGHDHAELYVLDVPTESGELRHVATVAAPIAGQGIAWDRTAAGTALGPSILFGIVRRSHEVVSMEISQVIDK